MSTTYKEQLQSSGLSGGNATYVEELYENYLADPDSVSAAWQQYFSTIKGDSTHEKSRLDVQHKFEILAQMPLVAEGGAVSEKQIQVLNLIESYRQRGHWHADIDPAHIRDRHQVHELSLESHQLSDSDLDTTFHVNGAFGQTEMTLRDLVAKLEATYCTHVGLEANHVWDLEELAWLEAQFEGTAGNFNYSKEEKLQFLKQLVAADGMEKYLHTRYVGQKRFSLEGGDALIPLVRYLIDSLAATEVEEICIGMAHRGRLNMLINILGKSPQLLFDEFDGKLQPAHNRSGDVKYHLGFSSRIETHGHEVDLSLMYNPSHLEFVNPVTLGSTRARLERRRIAAGTEDLLSVANTAVPILIHGDAALAGQGINQETLQLSQLRGFQVGGSIHIAVNNQIGFTTSNLKDARSSMYCTDIAKSIEAPIIHVNGDDPEAVIFAGKIASAYLLKFQKDVFIDLVCYRRLGHNEADEPAATQPIMYQKIRAHSVPAKVYAEKLEAEGVVSADEFKAMVKDYRSKLESGERVAEAKEIEGNDLLAEEWKALSNQDWQAPVDTTFDAKRLLALGEIIYDVEDKLNLHPLVKRVMKNRVKMIHGEQPLDWGTAENLAYATILDQGYQVRMSGEDCGRGTFSHRHAVLHDQKTGNSYTPLAHIKEGQPSVKIIDSLLSETGVLGFEYGYSTAEPKGLTIWEAQFGDFANVAQIIIDQFISSGEEKWGRYSGLTLLLPHGYEGQGPEHSSARLERYLQLCANQNMQVCVPTTPAQVYHMLRRQVLRQFRKPLVVMSPKSLLRHKLAVSTMEELAGGHFQEVIPEIDDIAKEKVSRVVLCCGKVYYDILEKRREAGLENVAIVRVEQLYPFPHETVKALLASYPENIEVIWAQEEPHNQGAWRELHESLLEALPDSVSRIQYVGRKESASTAAGYAKVHNAEQAAVVAGALGLETD